jgi:hypothetical protein
MRSPHPRAEAYTLKCEEPSMPQEIDSAGAPDMTGADL